MGGNRERVAGWNSTPAHWSAIAGGEKVTGAHGKWPRATV